MFPRKDWRFLAEKFILRKHPTFEPEVRKVIRNFSGDLAVDIGANMGVHTRLLSKRFKMVYAVEPNPKALAVLRTRIPRNVTVLDMAFSDSVGTTLFYTDPHPVTTSPADTILSKFKYNPSPSRNGWPSGVPHTYHGMSGLEVKTSTFDAAMKNLKTDFVLIDVEGAEFLVLEGMKDSLSNRRVGTILVELHDIDRRRELEQILSTYLVKWIDPDHLLATSKNNLGRPSAEMAQRRG
ncbi:MAG TPA: FkbM family methyltransferase [Candidatus Angelobacter sp.]|nr:FkbM family methyltransferase [Candidatus Angelobacter sp.]